MYVYSPLCGSLIRVSYMCCVEIFKHIELAPIRLLQKAE